MEDTTPPKAPKMKPTSQPKGDISPLSLGQKFNEILEAQFEFKFDTEIQDH